MKKNSTESTPKRGPGRPVSTNPKIATVQVRLTLDELATITAACGDMTISEWARVALGKAARRAKRAKAPKLPVFPHAPGSTIAARPRYVANPTPIRVEDFAPTDGQSRVASRAREIYAASPSDEYGINPKAAHPATPAQQAALAAAFGIPKPAGTI